MGQSRRCLVSFRDEEGVEHAEVLAASLYEAGAVALQQFRRSDWSREASLDTGTLRVEVCESTFYNVRVAELEDWLKRSGGKPSEVALRQKVRSGLTIDKNRGDKNLGHRGLD
jgi:hypothetical protein